LDQLINDLTLLLLEERKVARSQYPLDYRSEISIVKVFEQFTLNEVVLFIVEDEAEDLCRRLVDQLEDDAREIPRNHVVLAAAAVFLQKPKEFGKQLEGNLQVLVHRQAMNS